MNTNVLIALFTLIIAVATGIIAALQWAKECKRQRIENLKKTHSCLAGEREVHVDEALRYYRKSFHGAKDVRVNYLIYRKAWMQDRGSRSFPPINEINVEIADRGPGENSLRNSICRKLPNKKDSYAENVKFYLEKKVLFNAPLYGLSNVVVGREKGARRICLQIKEGGYFDFYNTCEALTFELAYARRIKRKSLLDVVMKERKGSRRPAGGALSLLDKAMFRWKFPVRYKYRDLFDLNNRFAGIGINTLTILKNLTDRKGESHPYFLLHKRSTRVAESAGSYHVIPAGSYQPASMSFSGHEDQSDLLLENTILREFGEELLNIEEFNELNTPELMRKLKNLDLEMIFLGVGLEPLNTKAEILTCLIIDMTNPGHNKIFNSLKTTVRNQGEAWTRESLEKAFSGTYEGSVVLKPLTKDMVNQFKDNPRCTPSFREIMQIVGDHRQFFGVEE